MAAITRPPLASIQAPCSATAAPEQDPTETPRSQSSATRGSPAIAAYTYAQVQDQVWHWKATDSGLDMT